MIPPFDETGLLPPGIHPATLAEIEARFGRESEVRRAQMESIRWMLDLAVRAGALRIVLNGSFVTDIMEPNDVDCALLFPPGPPADRQAFKELRSGLPFLEIMRVRRRRFEELIDFFGTDRFEEHKGMLEVIV